MATRNAKTSKATPKSPSKAAAPKFAPTAKYFLTPIGIKYSPGGKAGNAENWEMLQKAIKKGLTVAQAAAENPCPNNKRFLGYCIRKDRVSAK